MATHTNVSSLQRTVEETQVWLNELAERPEFRDADQAYSGLRVALHALRDRLDVGEAAHLASLLPMLVRGIYYEGWRPVEAPSPMRSADAFLIEVATDMRNAALTMDPEQTTRAIFAFLEEKLDPGEIEHVKGQLHKELQALWPTPASRQQH